MSSRKERICLKQEDAFGIWEQFKFTYVTSYSWICKLEIFLSGTLRKANQIRAWETTWSPQAAEAQLSCWLVRLCSDPVGSGTQMLVPQSHTQAILTLSWTCPPSKQSHSVQVKHRTKGAAGGGDGRYKFLTSCWYSNIHVLDFNF